MSTDFFVEYDLYDITALQDAQESTESNSSFADLSLIKDNIPAPRYGTLEHNFFVLDGSMEEFPDSPDNIVYFSKDFIQQNPNYWYCGSELYAGDGLDGPTEEFVQKQSITIQFSGYHTSYGITLHFANEYPLEIEIAWYDLAGILQSRKRFNPDSLIYFCKNPVEEYAKIEICFMDALLYHNVKIQYIEYGTNIVWGYDNIKSGTLVNDADPTSDKIKTDKLMFDFVDPEEEFNFGNSSGLHRMFQRNQRLLPYEMVDGRSIVLGSFFLDNVSTTRNVTKISAIDYKGRLSNTDFIDGGIYDGKLAGDLIDEIMSSAGITDYDVDSDTRNTSLYGTLGIQTCQKALREVLFACGSVIDTSLRTGIEIRRYGRAVTSKINRSRKFSTTYETEKYVSDITVKYKTWKLEENESELTKGVYEPGTHIIRLSNPAENVTSSSGEITKRMPYYIILNVEELSEVIISGQKYVGEELSAISRIENIKSGEVRSAKNFTGTLLDYEAAKRAANRILEYYQLQQIIKTKHLADGEKAGEWMEIENMVDGWTNFTACAESLTTDLTGGFISTSKCRGYFNPLSGHYYADEELYAATEMGGII